jgi:hypothetical protein
MPYPKPAPGVPARLPIPLTRLAYAVAIFAAAPLPAAQANNYGESASWQFAGPQDLMAQAAARDMIERRRGGVYAAPIYNTNIARQYNCSVSASAIGNNGAQSALANSPTTTGASSRAAGNTSSSSVAGDGTDAAIDNGQSNSGTIGSTVNGSTMTHVAGTAWQSLNSSQSNSGNQSASVSNANACAFGVLN